MGQYNCMLCYIGPTTWTPWSYCTTYEDFCRFFGLYRIANPRQKPPLSAPLSPWQIADVARQIWLISALMAKHLADRAWEDAFVGIQRRDAARTNKGRTVAAQISIEKACIVICLGNCKCIAGLIAISHLRRFQVCRAAAAVHGPLVGRRFAGWWCLQESRELRGTKSIYDRIWKLGRKEIEFELCIQFFICQYS